jgi:hypothetical protein
MAKRLLLLVALVAAPIAGVGVLPGAIAADVPCGAGATAGSVRLATDPAGDTTYANQSPEATDAQEDLRYVDAAVVPGGTARFVVGVEDLGTDDPPASAGLLVSLDITTDVGSFLVEASRSVARGDAGTGTIDGESEGVTATFDPTADTVTVSGPAALLPDRAATLSLTTAETRADGGVVLAPLTDTASGSCSYGFGKATETARFHRKAVTVTIIDTGIEASNPEFDFDETVDGPNGQLVGWWDFSATTKHAACGAPTVTWCSTTAPYDPDLTSGSHGTGTSGMAAGTNASPVKSPSACPGCNLAVAKVLNEDDDLLDGSMAEAIRWAVDVVHTDVISVSIGARFPIPEPVLHGVYAAQRYARERGVLVLFANGNGWENSGIPGQPGGFMNYGNSVDVLSVGASDLDGLFVTTDPEVVAPYTVVTSSSKDADDDGTADGYHEISGTSFSTPFTAGIAAHLISSGRLCKAPDLSPAFIEQLIKDTATDTTIPPSHEGYGVVGIDTLQTALGVLCNGDERPVPDPVTKTYVDHVSGTERMVSSDVVSGWTVGGPTIVRSPDERSTPGVLGLSTPTVADTEIFEVTVRPGRSIDATFSYVGDTSTSPDFDVYAYDVTDGVSYTPRTLVAKAASTALEPERLQYRNTSLRTQKVRIVVTGFTIITDQAFAVSGTRLGAPVDEGVAAVTIDLTGLVTIE